MTESLKEKPDFDGLWQRYRGLGNGAKAELRRVTEPDDLREQRAFYLLMPGAKPTAWALRVVFVMPWLEESGAPQSLTKAFVAAKISDRRLYQVVRADSPQDLIHLRRLIQQVKPSPEWKTLGATLVYWGAKEKRKLLEEFFIATTARPKKAGASK